MDVLTSGEPTHKLRGSCKSLRHFYFDPADLSQRQIHKVIVVTSHAIRKETVESLQSALRGVHRDGDVDLIDGQRLWELLQQTPEKTVLDTLHRAGTVLSPTLKKRRNLDTLSTDR